MSQKEGNFTSVSDSICVSSVWKAIIACLCIQPARNTEFEVHLNSLCGQTELQTPPDPNVPR